MSDEYNLRIREAMIQRVQDNDLLNGCERGTESDNPEYAKGIAEFIAATTLLSTEDGIGHAAESILPQLYPNTPGPVPLAAWEQHLLNGYAIHHQSDGSLYLVRYTNKDTQGRFDLQDAINAARTEFGGGGVVLLSTRWYRDDVETHWTDGTEVRWHFQKY